MTASAAGLVAKATACSGLTTGGTTTGVEVVEVVDVLVVVGARVVVVVGGTVDGGTVV